MWTTSFNGPTSVDHHPTSFEYLLMTGSVFEVEREDIDRDPEKMHDYPSAKDLE